MKVLIVDDMVDVARSFKEDLEFWGHSVDYTLSGSNSIDILSKDSSYDLILMDYWHGNILPPGSHFRDEIVKANNYYKNMIYIYSSWTGLAATLPLFLSKKDAIPFINKQAGLRS